MAHDSNRIYSPNINLVDDLYQFWMVGTRSTGGKYSLVPLVRYLCENNKINMWARNKPEATGPAYRKLTDAERKANNFGLRPPATYQSIALYSDAIDKGNLAGWTYDYPKESRGDPFRIGDFDNYRNDSLCPFPSYAGSDCLIYTNPQGRNEIKIQLSPGIQGVSGNTDYINLNDLQMSGADFANWYPGIYIRKSSSIYWLITSDAPLGSSLLISLNTAELTLPSAGSYQCYVFLANKKFKVYSSSGIAVSGGVQIVPVTTNPVAMNVVTSAQALSVFAVYQPPRKLVVTVTNMNASQAVITPVQVEYAAGGGGSGAQSILASSLEAFSVPAGSASNPQTVTKSYTVPPLLSGSVRLVFRQAVGTGVTSANQFTPWTDIIQIMPSV